jgi:2-octaprenyl-6-methoxyphenol hydroxylase
LPAKPCAILDIRVSDGRVGRGASGLHLHFDHREAGAGPFGWMVEARSLRTALNRRLNDAPGLHLLAPATASVRREADGVVLQTADTTIRARLVVGAEGRDSQMRHEAGIPVTRLHYRQHGVVCAVAHDLPHRGVALEHFLPGGPFAQLPLAGTPEAPHASAIVWTERSPIATRLMALEEPAFGREVARRLGDHLGAVRPVGRRWIYPLSAMHAQRYVDTRLALVGDAAHGIHPIAGQGLNLGFRDVIALASLVTTAVGRDEDPGTPALLAQYQRARRPANLAMLAATDVLDRLFSTDARPVRLVRDLGIAAVQRMPRLKQAFMRAAMGV